MSEQIHFVSLDSLVNTNHIYRKYLKRRDFIKVHEILKKIKFEKQADFNGYGIEHFFLGKLRNEFSKIGFL